jgi:superfamily I DNA/RNA helicase
VPYTAVIVDEAQDLSCAAMRLVHTLGGDGRDGLTLLADPQQLILPGGCALAQAGISVAGREVVLTYDERNTAQILAFASRQATKYAVPIPVTDASPIGGLTVIDRPDVLPRVGPEPVVARFTSRPRRSDRMAARIGELLADESIRPRDIGVLCLSEHGVRVAADAVRRSGLPVNQLTDAGAPADAVTVATVRRAKGLEFKHVLVADVSSDCLDGSPPFEGLGRESWEVRRRELYVAMTRARDGLWVGVI